MTDIVARGRAGTRQSHRDDGALRFCAGRAGRFRRSIRRRHHSRNHSRAERRAGAGKHPLIALFTDGEEAGLLGRQCLSRKSATEGARRRGGECGGARHQRARACCSRRAPGDARLIDLYAAQRADYGDEFALCRDLQVPAERHRSHAVHSHAGFPGYNFAFADNVRYYHSPRDTRANLIRATLQMHGDNLLGVVRGLQQTDFAALKDGNDVYLSVLGLWLPRIPAMLALPLAILALLRLSCGRVAGARPQRNRARRFCFPRFMPLALLFGCVAVGFAAGLSCADDFR